MQSSVRPSKGRVALAGLGFGALALLGAACSPPTTPPPTSSGGGTTTTVNVTYACAGTGIIGPGGASPVGSIADQTTSVAITLPSSATVGTPFNVGVNVGNLNLAAAPGFLNLNAAGIVGSISVTGANGPATVAANNFVGNGASIDLNAAGTTATAASAGTKTVTVGNIAIQSGSTGFLCTPVGTPASASVNAA
jgi:hypothetical protein